MFRWLLHRTDESFAILATAGREAARRKFCGDSASRLLPLKEYGIMIYPSKDISFLPVLLPYFDAFYHNSGAMSLDSARVSVKILDINTQLFTKIHVYFYHLLSAELELHLNPQRDPSTAYAHQSLGATINRLHGKTTVYSDWNERLLGW